MPNDYINKVNLNNTEYDIKDTISGYISEIVAGSNITIDTDSEGNPVINSTASGSVESVSASGVLSSSGGANPTITHNTPSSSPAKSTQAIYPITIDSYGHITTAGSAATIPTVNNGALKIQKNTDAASSVYTANQSSDTTLKWTTTNVGSASGWSAGTMASIDTSKFNGGSFTQGTDSFTANTPTSIDTSKFSGGSFSSGTFSGGSFTQGTDTFSANTPTAITYAVSGTGTLASPGSLNVTVTPGSQASFSQGFDSFTAATHGSDSFTAASLASGFYSAGTAATFTQGVDQHTAASLANGFYSAGTTPSLTVTNTTVMNDLSKV